MQSTEGSPAPIRVFRPKWQIHFDDGTYFPAVFRGIHLGTVAEQKALDGTKSTQQIKKPFDPGWDILFIDNYVFEYCERANTTISFTIENGLPDNLNTLQNVAIDASSLSMDRHDVWYKKLRFILRNFPRVSRITVIATVILDIASTEYMTQPMHHMDVQNISVLDRIRHGILFGEDLALFPRCSETCRPSDFAIQAWNDLSNHWPTWKRRKENNTTPSMFMTAMVYFKKEWVSLDGEGGPDGPCRLGEQRVDVAGAMIRNELRKQWTAEIDEKRSMETKPKPGKQTSFFSLGAKNSMFSRRNPSSTSTPDSQAATIVGQN